MVRCSKLDEEVAEEVYSLGNKVVFCSVNECPYRKLGLLKWSGEEVPFCTAKGNLTEGEIRLANQPVIEIKSDTQSNFNKRPY